MAVDLEVRFNYGIDQTISHAVKASVIRKRNDSKAKRFNNEVILKRTIWVGGIGRQAFQYTKRGKEPV